METMQVRLTDVTKMVKSLFWTSNIIGREYGPNMTKKCVILSIIFFR